MALIPSELLFAEPERAFPQLSPDGSMLAYLSVRHGSQNLWVSGEPPKVRPMTDVHGAGVRQYWWAPDGSGLLYLQDNGGNEEWHLFYVGLRDGEARDLTPFRGVQAQLIALDPGEPERAFVALNRDDPSRHDLYLVRLATGELDRVAVNEGFSRWITGPGLVVAGAVRPTDDGGAQLLWRNGAGAPWRPVLEAGIDDAIELVFPDFPVVPSGDGLHAFLQSGIGAAALRLARLDVTTGQLETVLEEPDRDVLFVWYHPATREPELAFVHRDRLECRAVTPAAREEAEHIQELVPGSVFRPVSSDASGEQLVIEFASDVNPGSYWRYDRRARSGCHLFDSQPGLDAAALAHQEVFYFDSSDGLRIQGYLTFPPGRGRVNLPTVFVVHGGPEATDFWAYRPWVQLFANRGYLVVQVNFRGSIGFGKAFLAAARKQWGAAMHHDVLDAIAWVTGRGYADPHRLAMFGTSYGGYETLTTVTRNPGLLACAAAGMAPVNLISLMEEISPHWISVRAQFRHRLGDPVTERDMLWERSPLARADAIRSPLLLFYGENDPRVRLGEAEQLKRALESAGVPYEMLVIDGAGHFLPAATMEARMRVVHRVEAFFARHLDG